MKNMIYLVMYNMNVVEHKIDVIVDIVDRLFQFLSSREPADLYTTHALNYAHIMHCATFDTMTSFLFTKP